MSIDLAPSDLDPKRIITINDGVDDSEDFPDGYWPEDATLKKRYEYLRKLVEGLSDPAIELFRDEQKLQFYLNFLSRFAGKGDGSDGLPTLGKDIDGQRIKYTVPMFRAITQNSSHILEMRGANQAVSSNHRLFVVTGDFGTMETKVWNVEEIVDDGKVIDVYLETPGVPNKPFSTSPNPEDSPLQRAKVRRITEELSRHHKAEKVHIQMSNAPAKIWWGNFQDPEFFVGTDEVDRQLQIIANAQGFDRQTQARSDIGSSTSLLGEKGSDLFMRKYGLAV